MLFSSFKTPMGAVVVATAAVLSGCAHYEPYTGSDAAKVRFTYQGSGFGFNGTVVAANPLVNGECGKRVMSEMIWPVGFIGAERGQPNAGGAESPPKLYPRVEMFDSPDPILSNVAEVRLAPGRYALTLTLHGMEQVCQITPVIDVKASKQYVVDVFPGAGKCTASGKELQQEGNHLEWRPFDLGRGTGC